MCGRIGLAGGILLGLWALAHTADGGEPGQPPGRRAEGGDQAPTLLLRSGAGRVQSVALSADGKLLVTGTDDYKVRLWDVAGGREVRSFAGQQGVIVSNDGKWLVASDYSARLYELATGKQLRVFAGRGGSASPGCLALSDDGKWLLFDNQLFDTATGRKVHDVWVGSEGGWSDSAAAFSADGKHLVTAGGAWLRVWDVGTGRQTRIIRSAQSRVITAVAVSHDGKLVVANDDTLARLWDVATGKVVRTFEGHTRPVSSVVLSADDKWLATAGAGDNARLWEVATGKESRTFVRPVGNVFGATGPQPGSLCATMTPDARWLATGSTDGTARVWETATGKEVRAFRGSQPAHPLAVTADGRWLVNRVDQTAHLWDLAAGKPVRSFEAGRDWRSVSVSTDGKRLATLDGDGTTAQVRDGATGKPLRTFAGLTGFATLSGDGTRLVTGDDHKLAWVWDADTGKGIRAFEGHGGLVTAAALSEDGKQLVTGSKDRTARLWDTASGKAIRVFQGHTGALSLVALSRDGKWLVTGCADPNGSADDTIRVWELATGKLLRSLPAGGAARSVSVSPDGKWLATARVSPPVRVWDLETGLETHSLAGQEAWVALVAPPGGACRLFTVGDGNLQVWDPATGKELCRLANLGGGHWAVCAAAGRFDASDRRDLDGLHWVAGNQTFPLGHFADHHEPGLLASVMGNR
jgi:WD40 repeat protein